MTVRKLFLLISAVLCLCTAARTAEVATGKRPNLLMIGKRGRYLEVAYLEELNAHGFDIKSLSWDEISPEVLREFNAVIVTGYHNVMTHTSLDETRQRWLDEYMRAGGGVFMFLDTAGAYSGDFHAPVIRWLRDYGIEFNVESVVDPDREIKLSPENIKNRRAWWADKIEKHPVTKGVDALLWPSGWGGHTEAFTIPVTVDRTHWQPLVWSAPSATLSVAANVPKALWREQRPDGPFPLMAVRGVDQGRMAVIGISPVWVAWTPYHWSLGGVIMKNGEQGRKSDFWKLLENTYTWLSEPSLTTGLYGPRVALRPPIARGTPPVDWAAMELPPAPTRYYRGVVGAHSELSTGKGSVRDWVEAAKARGFDFIVFAEDLAHMDKQKWEKLQGECAGLSDSEFVAYAGLEYVCEAGLRGFLPWGNTRPWLFDKGYLTPDGKQIHVGRGWNARTGGWPEDFKWRKGGMLMTFLESSSNGFFDLAENAVPYWDLKGYNLIPAWTWEDGKLRENNLEAILHLNASHLNPAPYALDMMHDPAELKGAGQGGRPFLVVAAGADPRIPAEPTMQNLLDRMAIAEASVQYRLNTGNYRGWHGPVATQGPEARLIFRGGYRWKGNEFPRYWIERYRAVQDEDWFMPSWYRLKLRLDARSDAGLAEIVLYDGEEIIRRYRPDGARSFAIEFEMPQNRNHHICALITDVNGHQALTREVWMEQQMNGYNYCGDHVNVPGGTYHPVHGQPYHRVFRQHRDVAKEAKSGRGGDEVRHFFVRLCSPDLYITGYRSAWEYKLDEIHDQGGWHNWAKHYPRQDYHFTQRTYGWYWSHGGTISYDKDSSQMPCWDGYSPRRPLAEDEVPESEISVFDSVLEPLQPVPVDGDGFFAKTIVRGEWPVDSGVYAIVLPDGEVIAGDWRDLEAPLQGALPSGAVVIGAPNAEAVFGDSVKWQGEGLAYRISKQQVKGKDQGAVEEKGVLEVGVQPGDRNRAGEKIAWRIERINRRVPVAQLAKPDWFALRTGSVDGMQLCELHVQAEDGVADLTIKRAALETNAQPIIVAGIRQNATCYLYDKSNRRFRPIGAWDGKAYVQIPGSATDRDLVIGNLILPDHPEVVVDSVALTDRRGAATGEWLVNVHNPTDQAIKVTLRCPAAFDAVRQRRQQLDLPPHSSQQVRWQ